MVISLVEFHAVLSTKNGLLAKVSNLAVKDSLKKLWMQKVFHCRHITSVHTLIATLNPFGISVPGALAPQGPSPIVTKLSNIKFAVIDIEIEIVLDIGP